MDIRIHAKRDSRGILATVRVLTARDVVFHRIRLHENADLWGLQAWLAQEALARMEPEALEPVVTMQAALGRYA